MYCNTAALLPFILSLPLLFDAGLVCSYCSFEEYPPGAQFIFSIFRQTPLHVSGISLAHHQDVHYMDTTIGTPTQPRQQTVI